MDWSKWWPWKQEPTIEDRSQQAAAMMDQVLRKVSEGTKDMDTAFLSAQGSMNGRHLVVIVGIGDMAIVVGKMVETIQEIKEDFKKLKQDVPFDDLPPDQRR